MEMLSGAEMIVQSLINEGVEQIFGYPGGSVLDIYDALHEKPTKLNTFWFVTNKPQHIWQMSMRATGKPGVVLVCSGLAPPIR